MDGGVVKDENMIVVGVMFLKNVHSVVNLPENVLICKVTVSVHTRPEKYSSRLLSIGGNQSTIVCRDEVGNHQ